MVEFRPSTDTRHDSAPPTPGAVMHCISVWSTVTTQSLAANTREVVEEEAGEDQANNEAAAPICPKFVPDSVTISPPCEHTQRRIGETVQQTKSFVVTLANLTFINMAYSSMGDNDGDISTRVHRVNGSQYIAPPSMTIRQG